MYFYFFLISAFIRNVCSLLGECPLRGGSHNRRATPKWRRLTAKRDEGISRTFLFFVIRKSVALRVVLQTLFIFNCEWHFYPQDIALFFPSRFDTQRTWQKCRNKGANFDAKYSSQCTLHNIGVKYYTSRRWSRRRRRWANDKCTHSRTQDAPMLWCHDMNQRKRSSEMKKKRSSTRTKKGNIICNSLTIKLYDRRIAYSTTRH
jgi:hypothetical protein